MLIRAFAPNDVDAVVELSLRAWAPVFASIEREIDPELFREFYAEGWRSSQRAAVEDVLTNGVHRVWIAEEDSVPVGFVAIELRTRESIGEMYMIAVDPEHQGRGIGVAMTEFALEQIRNAGLTVAMVETGADPGHAPARRLYEKSGFSRMPIVRYFKRL